ncbi:hypothetical protein [Novosphingobium sp. CCH12-A3]|nr:hypothetical protein [Novosphingobium sp. CCH12-A3]
MTGPNVSMPHAGNAEALIFPNRERRATRDDDATPDCLVIHPA